MARSQSFDTDQVLERAMLLFWERGYEHTSMDDLFGVMGISCQSLYNTFGGKRALFEAALERYQQLYLDKAMQPMERADSGRNDVIVYMNLAATTLGSQDERIGCLYVNATSELSALDALAATRFEKFYLRIKNAFINSLTNDLAGGWVPKQAIEKIVPLLVSISYGMPLMVKAGADKLDLLQAAETANQLLT